MDERAVDLGNQLFTKWRDTNPEASPLHYQYTVEWYVEQKLMELASDNEKLRRELDIEKQRSLTWKESFLSQINENIKMQAKELTNEDL